MFSIAVGLFLVIKGCLIPPAEAESTVFPVKPIDGKCPLPDKSGLVDPQDELFLDNLCTRIECINFGTRYYLMVHSCGEESVAQVGQECILLKSGTGSYPECCPEFKCEAKQPAKKIKKREEQELCRGYADPREAFICKLSLTFLLSCLRESFETWQWPNVGEEQDSGINLSEEKTKKFVLNRKRREEELSDDENDVDIDPRLWMEINFCFYFIEGFVNDSLNSEEEVLFSKEISDLEEQNALDFVECLMDNPSLPSDAEIDPRTDEERVKAHLMKIKRDVNTESDEFLTPPAYKIIFALQQCAIQPKSNELLETQKRLVQRDVTSSEEVVFEFFFCLLVHPESVPVFERELAKELRKLEDTPESTMIRIARQALEEHQELTEEEMKAVREVLECTGILPEGDYASVSVERINKRLVKTLWK